MFSLIKQVFIVLQSFNESLARVAQVSNRTKCLSLNNKLCMLRPTIIDLSCVELKYYPFILEAVMSYRQKYVF